MTDVSQRIANLSPEKRALLEKRLAEAMLVRPGGAEIEHEPNEKPVPSFGQERLWLLEQFHGRSSSYNLGYAVRMEGVLDVAALQSALNAVALRHEPLRTLMITSAGKLRIEVLPAFDVPVTRLDLSGRTQGEQEEMHAAALQTEVNRPFDLEHEPAFRTVLYRLGEHRHVLQLTLHHASSDGWSTGILFRDLSVFYSAAAQGVTAQLPELSIAFSDYARWQRQQLAGPEGERLIAYWKSQLQGSSFALELPTDRPRPPRQTFNGAVRHHALPIALGREITSFCMREQVTPFMVLLAALNVVLSRYTGQSDILIGSATAARPRVEVENLVGFFTNTLIFRGRLEGDPTFRELLHQVRHTALGAYAHQELPLQLLADELDAERDLSRPALFQVMLLLQNTERRKFQFHGLETRIEELRNNAAKFDLLIETIPTGETFNAVLDYNADLFDAETIDRLWRHLSVCLEAAMAKPEEKAARLPLLTAGERQQLLVEWNATERAYPQKTPLAELIEAQVERSPDATALVFGEKRLTYREMNERANRLAGELRKHGVGPERLVAVCLNRSLDMVVALLAIVKAGGAYLPLDPRHPSKRLAHTLKDSGVQLLVTEKSAGAELPPFEGTTILLEDQAWQSNSSHNLGVAVGPDNLAYVLYTSGSTGNPKGVQIPRKALTNLLWSTRDSFELGEKDRLLAVTTVSFDISGLEVWVPLLVGAQIVIATREEAADGLALRALLEHHDITILQGTPVLWRLLFDAGWRGKANLQASCGGEAMPPEFATQLAPVVRRLWNLYGPTETTIWSTVHEVRDEKTPISIGRPIANTQCYILDKLLQLTPAGVPGDLYIGGEGLARGYLNRPELTAEKFLPDPFRGPEARMYKTGDVARYRPDGTLEFMGRTDQLVKIRGFRVELGEIEQALKAMPEINQAVVIAREDTPGDKRLVAYLVAATAAPPGASELRQRLKGTLPDYSVPTSYLFLDRMPISPSGKIDLKALPVPDIAQSQTADSYVAPRNHVEEVLAGIWAEVLKVSRIGARDDFFEMGGDSLQAARILVKVIAAIPGCTLSLAGMMKTLTVEQLARTLASGEDDCSLLVQLRAGGNRTPFFFVPGAGGNVLNIWDLGKAMPANIPFYCLQARGLDRESEPFASVEETAEHFIGLIREVQPHGPYQIGGHCSGGLVAFEMARRLREMGEEVGTLALLDTNNPAFGRASYSLPKQAYLKARYLARKSRLRLGKLGELKVRDWGGYLLGCAKNVLKLSQVWIPIPEGREDLEPVLRRVHSAGVAAAGSFIPRPYDGKILLFRAGDHRYDRYPDELLGWGRLALGGVTTVAIEADHLTILAYPAVNAIADRLNCELLGWETVTEADEEAALAMQAWKAS